VGFTLEGVHRAEMITNDKYDDRLYYGLLSEEIDIDKYPLVFIG